MKQSRFLALTPLLMLMLPLGCEPSSTSPPSDAGAGEGGAFGVPDGGGGSTDGGGGGSSDGAAAIDCPTPAGGPTTHASGAVDTETWTAAASPHIVPSTLGVRGTLTIEPCAEVLIAGGAAITVGATGKLVAEGLATKPIRIGARDAGKPFARLQASGGGTLRLAYTTVEGGGDPENGVVDITGAIYAQGEDQTAPTQPTVFVDHVTVKGSKSNGLLLHNGAGFAPGSQDLVVTGSAQYPLSIWARAVGTVPTGKYIGNAVDEIVLPAGGGAEAIHEDATMQSRGVPYRVGNSLSQATLVVERQAPSSPGLATLTIEAGVKVRVKKGGVIHVQRFVGSSPAQGALVVNGTAAEPVVFTSAEATPAAGDWRGIWFGLVPAPSDKIDFARIEYAGGASASGSDACNAPGNNDAAIRIFGLPSGPFVTNTTILESAGHGIDRGWRDDAKPDFLPTNTFTSVFQCRQSYPRDTSGACPRIVPCP